MTDQREVEHKAAIYAFLDQKKKLLKDVVGPPWERIAYMLAEEVLAARNAGALAQPGSRRYFITLTADEEMALSIYAQHNDLVKTTDGELTEHDRQHTIHGALKRLVETTSAAVRAQHERKS